MDEKKPKLFGTSGVRGETNVEITPELAMNLSIAFADWVGGEGKIVVGRDTRFGAAMLTHAISAGIESMGLDVIDCGVLPTPALGHALMDLKAAGGVMVTGSHMPPERVGLIYLDGNACYVSGEKALEIEDRYFRGLKRTEPVIMDSIGTMCMDDSRIDKYKDFLKRLINVEMIRSLTDRGDFKVVADPGNGTGVGILPELLEQCGIEVLPLHDTMKGYPERSPEPRAHTLGKTAEFLREKGASMGAALDLDADRVLFIDEEGRVVSEDVMGAVFGKWVFERFSGGSGIEDPICVTPVNSSGLIDYVAEQYGVEMKYCRIGQPDTERVLQKYHDRAVFAYEESGKYYFASDVHWCDGILSTLYLLQIMAEKRKSLGELTKEFPTFFQAKAQLRCSDRAKAQVYENVIERFNSSTELLEGRKLDTDIDGLKRQYEDNSWLLLRPSGTEPLFRLYSDAMSQDRANGLLAAGKYLVEAAIRDND